MSKITVENILQQIVQLPPAERARLRQLLDQQAEPAPLPKAPQDRQASLQPLPDYQDALQWLSDHAREYAGQWVALDGDRLIAHGPDAQAVYRAAEADGAYLPLVELVENPDAPPFAGF